MVLCNPLKAGFNAGQCVDPLGSWVGAEIWDICPFKYGAKDNDDTKPDLPGEKENHCAHFVGHALGHVSGAGARCSTLADWRIVDKELVKEINEAQDAAGAPKYKKLSKAEQKSKMSAAASDRGALTRCNQLYALCANRTQFVTAADDARLDITAIGQSLAFAGEPANFARDFSSMNTHPKKHVGIVSQGYVYHYSTHASQVFKDTIAEFITRKKGDYGADCLFVVTDLPG